MLSSSNVAADGRLVIRFALRSNLIATKGNGGNLVNIKYGAQLVCTSDGSCDFGGFIVPALGALFTDVEEVLTAVCAFSDI